MIAVMRHIPIEVLNPIERFFIRSISHPINVTLQIELILRIVVSSLVPSVWHLLVPEESAYRKPSPPHLIHFLILDVVG